MRSTRSAGLGMSSTTAPTWPWRAVPTRRPRCGSPCARSPRRCSSRETFTRCAPDAPVTPPLRTPPPPPLQAARRRSIRSPYEEAPLHSPQRPSTCSSCPPCCCLCSGYRQRSHKDHTTVFSSLSLVDFPLVSSARARVKDFQLHDKTFGDLFLIMCL